MVKTKKYLAELTHKEYALVLKLRRLAPYGVFEIHKINGEPVRIVVKENLLLNDEEVNREVKVSDGIQEE